MYNNFICNIFYLFCCFNVQLYMFIRTFFTTLMAVQIVAFTGVATAQEKASARPQSPTSTDSNAKKAEELNTAFSSSYMQPIEREMIREINFVRKYPKVYATIVAKYLKEKSALYEISKEEVITGNELIAELEKSPSLNVLQPKECLYNAARSHGMYQKRVKKIGHAGLNNLYVKGRLEISCGQSNHCGENLVGGGETVRSSLITLLIDDGISDRGHRRNILNSDWKYVGCHHADEVNGVINSWVQVFTNK